uniref:Protein kinase domain-containing protein n=1 Tax=Glycine max TaxID=3847 RepID=K7LAZ4_SOYBN
MTPQTHYTAPEAWGQLLKKSLNLFWDDAIGISAESDAWSFGCTLVEMGTGFVPWAGLSSEEIYQAVVKAKKLLPHYASVVGGGIPSDLWRLIGECLQFKPSKRPSLTAMLAIFLRHSQGMPRSLPASPNNDRVVPCARIRSFSEKPIPSSSMCVSGMLEVLVIFFSRLHQTMAATAYLLCWKLKMLMNKLLST